jgi:hypothetical protein
MNRFLLASAAIWLLLFSTVSSTQPDPHRRDIGRQAAALFTRADDCVACHNALVTRAKEDVSIGTMWRATIMANSGRDPYFHAGVRREIMDHPSHAAEIQDECAACHMPVLQRAAHAAGTKADILAQLPIQVDSADGDHWFAADGVSCTVCHQITSEKLGTRDSFNGRFGLTAAGVSPRKAFGPFNVDAGRTRIMSSVTGFSQTEAPHVRDSALCATCHTLYTQALGAKGDVLGELPEQMNFQEWQHSAFYAEQRSCQSCHMPEVPERTRIASVLGDEREGLSRHLFVGGNFVVLRMLDRYRDELGVAALSSELQASTRATLRQLEVETAALSVRTERQGGHVMADVSIRNLTGHKFPTGYPSRRTWIHLTARDASGGVVFESGAMAADGAIAGNDNDADAARFEPHYDQIDRPDQVQIYETIMTDSEGVITTGLLRAIRYVKDNRLLPRGFDKATAHADIAVHGDARADATFVGEGDRVHYLLPAGTATVDVELRYQPIAFRWAHNLRGYDAPEPKRFVGYFNELGADASALVARATARVE